MPSLPVLLVQDTKFNERVLDLVNLVLVALVGPDAQAAMHAAVDPSQQQVSHHAALVWQKDPSCVVTLLSRITSGHSDSSCNAICL